MNRGKRTLSMIVLTFAVSLAMNALAQQDDFLQRYDLAIENLDLAVRSVPDDSAQAIDELDQAVNALLSLSRDSTSTSLVSSMERLVERARTSVQNRSKADVGVQAAVLAGGFQRIVFESAFRTAVAGDLDTARARLLHIATDMGMPQATLDALATAPDSGSMRLTFESGVAQVIEQELAASRSTDEADRAGAYQALAHAYGSSLMIQDSPRLTTPMNDDFVAAAGALVAQDDAGFVAATDRLSASAQALSEQNSATLTSGAVDSTPASTTETGAAELPALGSDAASGDAGTVATDTAATGATTTPDATTSADATATDEAGQAPTATGDASVLETAMAEDATASTAPALDLEAMRALLETERVEAQRQVLIDQLSALGLQGPDADPMIDALLAAGTFDLNDAVQVLYADVGRATASVIAGDFGAAREAIERTARDYRNTLEPLVARQSSATDVGMRDALERGSSVVGLRMQDVDALTGQVDAVARVLAGQAAPANQAVNAQALNLWAGWPRLAVMLIFGILAFVPLYLLNLAFGGGNRNWQLIGVALLLPLLPIVYEALAAIGSLVAYFTGNDVFELLSTYSMFQSPIGQVAWSLLTMFAILFAISGLHGICVQFGLLGRGRGTKGPSATQTNTATMTSTGGHKASDSLVDWDEEF